jgi:hypothetical protein
MAEQLRALISRLRLQIQIPYEIRYVDRVIEKEEFEENVIYVHITIGQEKRNELVIERA